MGEGKEKRYTTKSVAEIKVRTELSDTEGEELITMLLLAHPDVVSVKFVENSVVWKTG